MARKSDGREFRLRPPKPKARRQSWGASKGFKLLLHYARSSGGGRKKARASSPHSQRCAVRVTYSKSAISGQWRAHGRYLARDTETLEHHAEGVGFTSKNERSDIAEKLERWQAAGDPLLWKIIVSPEFGDRADLPRLTRDFMSRMARDLETDLEWVAVAHHNTGHPHVHIALRGIRADGTPLRLNRNYIQQGLRTVAEQLCTHQLGYRSRTDAMDAERREIGESRFTSLDRLITRRAIGDDHEYFGVTVNPAAGERECHVNSRLAVLASRGLAMPAGPNTWRVRSDFESILRAMQRATDHQKTLAAHGVLASDDRLSTQVLQWQQHPDGIEGRVLVHGQEDATGRNYLLLEGTDAAIHFVYYTPEMEATRSRGGLRTNSFLSLRRRTGANGEFVLDIRDLGTAEALLKNRSYFEATAKRLVKRGIIPDEDGWGGWLGQYQAALRKAVPGELEKEHEKSQRGLRRDRGWER